MDGLYYTVGGLSGTVKDVYYTVKGLYFTIDGLYFTVLVSNLGAGSIRRWPACLSVISARRGGCRKLGEPQSN